MLRIKDNIDLHQLEKFGFAFMPDGIYMKQDDLIIYVDDMRVMCLSCCDENPNRIWYDLPNVIFDLIQGGLVEKIEEDKDNV